MSEVCTLLCPWHKTY